MTIVAEERAAALGLMAQLRSGTSQAHRSLEDRLKLLAPPLERRRFILLLQRFRGFHAVWEPALSSHPRLAATLAPRRRLALIDNDLEALGVDATVRNDAPECAHARELVADETYALGSFYVLEGSTLGGKFIARALRGEAWAPSGGLSYFDPYGADAGAMWRAFCRWLEEEGAGRDPGLIVEGARATFACLEDWLAA